VASKIVDDDISGETFQSYKRTAIRCRTSYGKCLESTAQNFTSLVTNFASDETSKQVADKIKEGSYVAGGVFIIANPTGTMNRWVLVNEWLDKQRIEDSSSTEDSYSRLNSSSREVIRNTITSSEETVKPVPCKKTDLIPHIILVHSIPVDGKIIDTAFNDSERSHYYEILDDIPEAYLMVFKKAITSQGILGSHLDLRRIEFRGTLQRRPHLHWAWNQLVQPHVVSEWEGTKIAILEPLEIFENTQDEKPLGVAPYDTMTCKPHKISKKAKIVVPKVFFEKAQNYICFSLKDNIVCYDDSKQTLRESIIDTLEKYYPETWHICDEKGELIGKVAKKTQSGFMKKTCLKKGENDILFLLQDEKGDLSDVMKEYGEKRFIGLHNNLATYMIEDEKNSYFTNLERLTQYRKEANFDAIEELTKQNEETKHNPLFVSQLQNFENLNKLGILSALKIYEALYDEFDESTNARVIANYIIKEAMAADFISLFYQKNPETQFDLSVLDLKFIFSFENEFFISLLKKMRNSLNYTDVEKREDSFNIFNQYTLRLETCYSYCQLAKNKVHELVSILEENKENLDQIPSLFEIAQEKWQLIDSSNQSEFDFERDWPLSDNLKAYLDKVLESLPSDDNKLKQLYKELSSFKSKNLKEQYRVNILCNVIKWIFQVNFYLVLRQVEDEIKTKRLLSESFK
jgi:hypothetical protein